MDYFLGIDIGTYESKAALIDITGALVATTKRSHPLYPPPPGFGELDAQRVWWGCFCALSKKILALSGIPPEKIAAVGASGIAPCCLPVDNDIQPLRNAILYGVDTRASKQIEDIKDQFGEAEILKKSWNPLTSQAVGPKILWIKENEPEIYKAASKFLTCSSYLVAKLTGNYVVDHYTAASYVPLYNPATTDWDYDTVKEFCPSEKLPQCDWTSNIAGKVSKKASAETGLAQGTPVIVGTADAAAEAISVGVISPGDLMLMLGSSSFMIHICRKAITDRRIWSSSYLFPNSYNLSAGMSTTGTLTRWFRDNFAKELIAAEKNGGKNAYQALMEEAISVPAGSGGLIILPYFSGERTPFSDPLARGVIFGLNLTHQRSYLYRAILESIGLGIAQHLEVFADIGAEARRIVAVGGGTQNPLWMQCISDVCQQTIETTGISQGASYGDALLAAVGVSAITIHQIPQFIRCGKYYQPNKQHASHYTKLLRQYKELYDCTRLLMHNTE